MEGRTDADGRGQRDFVKREDSTSPAISYEALCISLAIDAHENRHVATSDVVGAYLNAYMKDNVIVVFDGDMVEYMVSANPTRYEKFVHVTKDGKKKFLL